MHLIKLDRASLEDLCDRDIQVDLIGGENTASSQNTYFRSYGSRRYWSILFMLEELTLIKYIYVFVQNVYKELTCATDIGCNSYE